jgi:hypothetical protein
MTETNDTGQRDLRDALRDITMLLDRLEARLNPAATGPDAVATNTTPANEQIDATRRDVSRRGLLAGFGAAGLLAAAGLVIARPKLALAHTQSGTTPLPSQRTNFKLAGGTDQEMRWFYNDPFAPGQGPVIPHVLWLTRQDPSSGGTKYISSSLAVYNASPGTTQSASNPFALYAESRSPRVNTATQDSSQDVAATGKSYNRGQGTPIVQAVYAEPHHGQDHDGSLKPASSSPMGVTFGVTSRLRRKTTAGFTVGAEILSRAQVDLNASGWRSDNNQYQPVNGDAGLAIVSSHGAGTSVCGWTTGIRFDGQSTGRPPSDGGTAIDMTQADYNYGIDLGTNSLITGGSPIYFAPPPPQPNGAVADIWYNPFASRIQIDNGSNFMTI